MVWLENSLERLAAFFSSENFLELSDQQEVRWSVAVVPEPGAEPDFAFVVTIVKVLS